MAFNLGKMVEGPSYAVLNEILGEYRRDPNGTFSSGRVAKAFMNDDGTYLISSMYESSI